MATDVLAERYRAAESRLLSRGLLTAGLRELIPTPIPVVASSPRPGATPEAAPTAAPAVPSGGSLVPGRDVDATTS